MITYPDHAGPESSQNEEELTSEVSRFPNLRSAGRELVFQLEAYRGRDDVVVLGIVLGGVPVAQEVAIHLGAPLDLLIIRRLLAPQGPGSLICAVNVGGSMVIDEKLPPRPAEPSTPLDYFIADAIAELRLRERICRRGRKPIDLLGKTVILVDCGVRTGSTMRAAIEALETTEPAEIIAAAPVASLGGSAAVAAGGNQFVFLKRPRLFGHVGLWFNDFTRPDDNHVAELLEPIPTLA